MADGPALGSRRTLAHGSVEGLWKPPSSGNLSPRDVYQPPEPGRSKHAWVLDRDAWVPAIALDHDPAQRQTMCAWVDLDGRRLEGWVPWAEVREAGPDLSPQHAVSML